MQAPMPRRRAALGAQDESPLSRDQPGAKVVVGYWELLQQERNDSMTMSNKFPASCGLRRSAPMALALSAGLALFFSCCGISYGQEPSHLLTGPGLSAGGLAEGEMLLGELNCVGCHVASNEVRGRIFAKQPPLLGDVGDRITPNYLRDFLDNPQSQKPGTGMPIPLHGLAPAARKESIEDLVHFLSSFKSAIKPIGVEADGYLLETGRQLFHRVGCVACHEPQEDAGKARGKKPANPAEELVRQARAKAADKKDELPSVPLGNLSS